MARYASIISSILLFVGISYGQWHLGGDSQEQATVGFLKLNDSLTVVTGNIRFSGYGRITFNDGTYISSADSLGSLTYTLADNAVDSAKIATGAVQSSDIGNGQVFNIDVAAAAAIAGTKISPDFGTQDLTTTGKANLGGVDTDSTTIGAGGIWIKNIYYISADSTYGFVVRNSSTTQTDTLLFILKNLPY